jgi:WD40 repeat protein
MNRQIWITMSIMMFVVIFVAGCAVSLNNQAPPPSPDLSKTPLPIALPMEVATQPTDPTLTLGKTSFPTEIQATKLHEWLLPSLGQLVFTWTVNGEQFIALPAGSSTGNPAGGAVMYDANSLDEIWRLEPQGITIYLSSAAFSPDGEFLALYAGGTHILNAVGAPTIKEPQINNPGRCLIYGYGAQSVIWLHDGHTIVVGVNDDRQKSSRFLEVQLWDTELPKCVKVFARVEGMFRSMDLNSSGSYLALSTRQSLIVDEVTGAREVGKTIVWNLNTEEQICKIDGALVARFNPTSNLLLVSNFDNGHLSYWNVEKCELVSQLVDISHPYDFTFSANGQFLAVNEGNILIIDPGSGKTLLQIDSPFTSNEPAWYLATTLSFSPNGRFLLYSVTDLPKGSKLFLWNIEK